MKYDPDDLVDSDEVAAIIGLANRRGISVYQHRYEDFPAPVIIKGRCLLWVRQAVEEWARKTGRL